MREGTAPLIAALALSSRHGFSKQAAEQLTLIAGEGVAGDAHSGRTVRHRSRVRQDPSQPNLRQVHLIGSELLDELKSYGFALVAGDLGENVLTRGLDLLALPCGTRLHFPGGACLQITGLRNPCAQIEAFQPGLLARVVRKLPDGAIEQRAGVMAVVVVGGTIAVGDQIAVTQPDPPHLGLEVV